MNRPTPTHLKLLAGNPGKRTLNPHEPRPPQVFKLPPCPSRLIGEARRAWKKHGRLLIRIGVLTEADLSALELLCEAYGRWCELVDKVRETGPIIMDGKKIKLNPLTLLQDRAFRDYRLMCAEFGITPSSRSRVVAAGGDADDDLLD